VRIGELAAKAGVSVRALRYYEEQELLLSARTPSGQRRYPDSAVDRVRAIRELYDAGLPSRAIREVLPSIATGEVTQAFMDRLRAERHRIDQEVDDLLKAREKLDHFIASATAVRKSGHRCQPS
jgi:DNA-binding transcriptional MerR regulator